MKRFTALFLCAVFTVSAALPAFSQKRIVDVGPDYVRGEILVQLKAGSMDNDLVRVTGKGIGFEKIRKTEDNFYSNGDLVLVRFPKDRSFGSMKAEIEADHMVEFVEPNWIYTHQATSNDPQYTSGNMWGMYGDATTPANQWGSQAGEAWANNRTDCSSVYVGVIDEGYMFNHADLAANAGTNPGETAGNGIDDDGNGYIDDVNGWDFAGNNNTVFDGTIDDHGTHVAGTIGGVGGNGIGVAGVCWKVKLMSGKFLGSQGGTTANAIRAVDYFTDLKTRHNLNLVATNNSWGGGGFSQALADAINRANAADILFVAAAGNSTLNCETSSCYPAEYSSANVIAVASITNTGAISSFSNFGSTTVDLGAPGSGVVSTVPVKSGRNVVSGYAIYSGTSMASPHVAGAAALYAAYHPGSSAAQIKSAILGSVVPTTSLNGRTFTGGRLNVSGF